MDRPRYGSAHQDWTSVGRTWYRWPGLPLALIAIGFASVIIHAALWGADKRHPSAARRDHNSGPPPELTELLQSGVPSTSGTIERGITAELEWWYAVTLATAPHRTAVLSCMGLVAVAGGSLVVGLVAALLANYSGVQVQTAWTWQAAAFGAITGWFACGGYLQMLVIEELQLGAAMVGIPGTIAVIILAYVARPVVRAAALASLGVVSCTTVGWCYAPGCLLVGAGITLACGLLQDRVSFYISYSWLLVWIPSFLLSVALIPSPSSPAHTSLESGTGTIWQTAYTECLSKCVSAALFLSGLCLICTEATLCACAGGVAALMSISLSSIQHFIDDSLAALPDDFPLPDSHSKEAIGARWTFFCFVCVVKFALAAGIASTLHLCLNRLPVWLGHNSVEEQRRSRGAMAAELLQLMVMCLPACYLGSNCIMVLWTLIALEEGWMNQQSGLPFEFWNQWLNLLLTCHMLVLVSAYVKAIGVPVQPPVGGLLTAFLPGFGGDVQLSKDWLFIGVALETAARHPREAPLAILFVILSIVALFGPLLSLHQLSADASKVHLCLGFACFHWPTLWAVSDMETCASAYAGACGEDANAVPLVARVQRWGVESVAELMINCSTPAHWNVVCLKEIPQLVLQLLFVARFGWSRALACILVFSTLHIVSVPLMKQVLPTMLDVTTSFTHLRHFALRHGMSSTYVVKHMFGEVSTWHEDGIAWRRLVQKLLFTTISMEYGPEKFFLDDAGDRSGFIQHVVDMQCQAIDEVTNTNLAKIEMLKSVRFALNHTDMVDRAHQRRSSMAPTSWFRENQRRLQDLESKVLRWQSKEKESIQSLCEEMSEDAFGPIRACRDMMKFEASRWQDSALMTSTWTDVDGGTLMHAICHIAGNESLENYYHARSAMKALQALGLDPEARDNHGRSAVTVLADIFKQPRAHLGWDAVATGPVIESPGIVHEQGEQALPDRGIRHPMEQLQEDVAFMPRPPPASKKHVSILLADDSSSDNFAVADDHDRSRSSSSVGAQSQRPSGALDSVPRGPLEFRIHTEVAPYTLEHENLETGSTVTERARAGRQSTGRSSTLSSHASRGSCRLSVASIASSSHGLGFPRSRTSTVGSVGGRSSTGRKSLTEWYLNDSWKPSAISSNVNEMGPGRMEGIASAGVAGWRDAPRRSTRTLSTWTPDASRPSVMFSGVAPVDDDSSDEELPVMRRRATQRSSKTRHSWNGLRPRSACKSE